MKAKLIFKLPEESEEFDYALHGSALGCVIRELDEQMRRREKEGKRVTASGVREIIRTELQARDVEMVLG